MSPTNDPDHDGRSNLAEWIARTDPTNEASWFRIDEFACTNGMATLTFTGWSNRLYQAYCRETLLTNGAWTIAVSSAFAGADGSTAWTDTNLTAAVTTCFYRMKVLLPP